MQWWFGLIKEQTDGWLRDGYEVEEAFGRIGSLDRFTDRSLPVLIDQSISTYLQEFLSVPDKLQLIEFDNTRIYKLARYFEDEEGPIRINMFVNQ